MGVNKYVAKIKILTLSPLPASLNRNSAKHSNQVPKWKLYMLLSNISHLLQCISNKVIYLVILFIPSLSKILAQILNCLN